MTLALITGIACAQPFTYQGMLKQNGQPVNATLSMTFKLYDALTGGNQVGSSITQNVAVQNGLFTVQLDFGSVWTGQDRYLEIAVGSTVLSPRVRITPAPHASYAASAGFAQLPWQTVGSNIFYTSGNVGIGTNNPAARLSLGGGDANTKLALWQGNSATEVMGFGIAPNQFRIHLHNPNNRFSFLDAPNGNEIMTILGNGKVGIGMSSPSEQLHVNGNIRLADDRSIFGLDSLVGYNDLKLYGDSTGGPDVYIAPSGNVGMGVSSPSERLHVNGNIRLADDRSIFGLDSLVGYNDLKLYGDASRNQGIVIYPDGDVWVGPPHRYYNQPYAKLTTNGTLDVLGDVFISDPEIRTAFFIMPRNLFGTTQDEAVTLDINGNGTLGIWDNLSVTDSLHVGGSRFTLGGGTDPSWRRVEAGVDSAYSGLYVGYLVLLGANGNNNVLLAYTGNSNHGVVNVCDANGNGQAGMYVADNGNGVVWGDSKNFRVPDPEDATRDIWYGCIEGPELAMYVRGTARLVNGRARIELPDHFRKLADEQGMTVQLTPLSPDSKGLCVVRKGLDGIEVAELLNGRGNYEFDWEVKAVRKEHRDFRVYRPWDEVLLGGADPAQAWEARLKSIQDRQARQQAKEDKR
ncbi:MAG: hypothetical protein KatS3mg019_2545 [Fimbriimonadales bacterium]|nr:MAG: hypothetical protein KatS3mg019_2545 [Fimbriimonadales bacterium]